MSRSLRFVSTMLITFVCAVAAGGCAASAEEDVVDSSEGAQTSSTDEATKIADGSYQHAIHGTYYANVSLKHRSESELEFQLSVQDHPWRGPARTGHLEGVAQRDGDVYRFNRESCTVEIKRSKTFFGYYDADVDFRTTGCGEMLGPPRDMDDQPLQIGGTFTCRSLDGWPYSC